MSDKIYLPDEQDKFVDDTLTRVFDEFSSDPRTYEIIPKIANPTMVYLLSYVAHTAFEILRENEFRRNYR